MAQTLPEDLVSVPGVTLVEVGEWDASTGPVEFTSDDLRAAVAALDDPAVHNPRLRIGHTDPAASIAESAGGFDEQPCFGKFTNLRLTSDGQAIVADMTGLPQWLAELLPIAYPSRSIEGYFDVKTASGKEHGLVITSVALLGVSAPAVETLEDLAVLFSADGPEGVELIEGTRVAASRERTEMPERVAASASFSDVRRAFYEDFATEESGRYWWWIYEAYADPLALIVCDDSESAFYLVTYAISGDQITFADEPVEVVMQWIEKEGGKVAAASFVRRSKAPFAEPTHSFATAAESRPKERNQAAASRPDNEEDSMPDIDFDAERKRLGLPEDATEEQISEALAAEETEEEVEQTETEETEETSEVEQPEPVAAADGTVQVDKGTWETVQAQAREGAAARAEQINIDRERKLDEAVKAGKIPPGRKDHYRKLHKADPEGTEQLLASLAENTVPVSEVGVATTDSDEAVMQQIRASYGLEPGAGKE